MISDKLEHLVSTEWVTADSLGRDVHALKVIPLHKIKTSKAIEKVCRDVINAVEMSLLVTVDEWILEKRKLKKQQHTALQYSEVTANSNGANVRKHWASKRWKDKNPPRGWVYYDTDWSLLGTIYETSEEKWYTAFIQRKIADNPHGAFLLMKEMKDRLEKLLQQSQKSHQ